MILQEIKYNLYHDEGRGDFLRPLHGTTPTTEGKIKVKKELLLETKNTQNHENGRLGLIESPPIQHCSLRGCIRRLKRYSIFKITRMCSMVPKEIRYNLHHDNVRGGFLRPPHGTRTMYNY